MIKNLIYLDKEKMYSLSSQIFEGITEYILDYKKNEKEEKEEQKGPVGSGKVMGDIIRESSGNVHKKFLHDYSYSLFEQKLIEDDMVLSIDTLNIDKDNLKESLSKYSFIKIKGKTTFSDVEKVIDLFQNFNTIGEALAHMGAYEQILQINQQIDAEMSKKNDRNDLSKLKAQLKELTNIKKLAKEGGLYQDPTFLDNISLLIKYGFSDQFELYQESSDVLFSSCLKREFLKESEDYIVKKYSRKPDKEFVVFGIVSQSFSKTDLNLDESKEYPNIKAALMSFIEHLTNIESTISGKQPKEIVIDPIAVYLEM